MLLTNLLTFNFSFMANFRKPIPAKMQSIINGHAAAMAGVGGVAGLFGPGLDSPVIIGSWIAMTIRSRFRSRTVDGAANRDGRL